MENQKKITKIAPVSSLTINLQHPSTPFGNWLERCCWYRFTILPRRDRQLGPGTKRSMSICLYSHLGCHCGKQDLNAVLIPSDGNPSSVSAGAMTEFWVESLEEISDLKKDGTLGNGAMNTPTIQVKVFYENSSRSKSDGCQVGISKNNNVKNLGE